MYLCILALHAQQLPPQIRLILQQFKNAWYINYLSSEAFLILKADKQEDSFWAKRQAGGGESLWAVRRLKTTRY